MDKFLFVEQPPLTPKFNFLVDGLTPNKQYGEATDIEKIEYNLNILGNEIKLETEIQTILLTKKKFSYRYSYWTIYNYPAVNQRT
jgi:hypothetical protein